MKKLFIIIITILIFQFQEKYLLSRDNLIYMHDGNFPVVISAPHGGKNRNIISSVPLRKGRGVKDFRYKSDFNTDLLAKKTADLLWKKYRLRPYLIVAEFSRRQLDVNRGEKNAYEHPLMKKWYRTYHSVLEGHLRKAGKKSGMVLLLDIHGQGQKSNVIFRGTRNGNSVKGLLKKYGKEAVWGRNSITGFFKSKGHRVLPDKSFNETKYQGGYILKKYGSRGSGGVDAMQLEFGIDYRKNSGSVERTSEDLAHAIYVFYKSYLKKSR